jgi:hypothetical protein
MSENKPGADDTQGKGAKDRPASPSRRRILKAAAATAPVIMSIKARPALAQPSQDPQQNSASMSHNMSQRPTASR